MILFSVLALGFAHKPSFGDTYTDQELAFEIQDPNISIVLYDEVTCEDPLLWMSFEATAGFDLYVQGGVPEIERLSDYKPTIAIIAPGFPEAEDALPFDIPEGLGVVVLEPEEEPSDFYEPFTQTSSWIWIEDTLTLPEDGTGYVVAWNNTDTTGKLWIAVGTVEDFSDVETTEFISWNELVNNYHETGKFEIPPPTQEISCLEVTDDNHIEKEASSGCMHTPKRPSLIFYLFAIVIILRRKTLP